MALHRAVLLILSVKYLNENCSTSMNQPDLEGKLFRNYFIQDLIHMSRYPSIFGPLSHQGYSAFSCVSLLLLL